MWISDEVMSVLSPFPIHFNGVDLTKWFFPKQDRGRGLLEREVTLISISGRPGALLTETRTPARRIAQEILVACSSSAELRKKLEELNAILHTESPVPLVFGDEPDRTYLATYAGASEGYQIEGFYTATIEFVCPDSYKYGAEQTAPLTGAPINITGTAKADPIFTVELKAPTTFIAVGDGTEVNMVGSPAEAIEIPYVREELKLNDNMSSFISWTDSPIVDDGQVGGAMVAANGKFSASSYGAGTGWHGPAKKRALSEALTDFRADINIRQKGSHLQLGRVTVNFLDVNGIVVGSISMAKPRAQNIAVFAYARVGNLASGHTFMATRGRYDYVWQHFDGLFRIQRIGNLWEAYVNATGERGSFRVPFRDTRGQGAAPITAVEVHIASFGTYAGSFDQAVDDIKVYKINPPGTNQIPYIGEAGDIFEFDHAKNKILKNGLDYTAEKAMIGEFFKLPTGLNNLVVEPEEKIQSTTANVRWRSKWL